MTMATASTFTADAAIATRRWTYQSVRPGVLKIDPRYHDPRRYKSSRAEALPDADLSALRRLSLGINPWV